MEQKYTLTIDPTTQLSKPATPKGYGIIRKNLNQVVELTAPEIAKYSSKPYSYTFSPAILNESAWGGQQIFMLDFDNGTTPKVIIDRLTAYKIIPNIIYYTFSHTEENPRFRLVILVDTPIYDSSIAEIIRKGLVKGFPECDQKCGDSNRMFLGGHKNEELNLNPNRIEQLVLFASIHIVASDKQQTRNLQKFGCSYNRINRDTQISSKNTNSQLLCTHRNEYISKQKNVVFNYDLLKVDNPVAIMPPIPGI